MGLGPGDLVLCAGTLPRDSDFRERVDAAVAGGFTGLSMWGRDYGRARAAGLTDADMRVLLADHGVSVAEIDPAWWWLPGASGIAISPDADPEEIFGYGERELFALGEALGARSLNAVDVFGGEWTVDDAAEAFAGLCDRAAEHDLLVHIEWLPWSRIPDLATAWEIVRLADRLNGGLAVDAWHHARSGWDDQTLRSIPGYRILGVQLDDGPAAPEADLLDATLHHRLLPGEGEFDLRGLVDALQTGDAVAPIGVEVFSDELHGLGAREAARRAGESVRGVLAAVP